MFESSPVRRATGGSVSILGRRISVKLTLPSPSRRRGNDTSELKKQWKWKENTKALRRQHRDDLVFDPYKIKNLGDALMSQSQRVLLGTKAFKALPSGTDSSLINASSSLASRNRAVMSGTLLPHPPKATQPWGALTTVERMVLLAATVQWWAGRPFPYFATDSEWRRRKWDLLCRAWQIHLDQAHHDVASSSPRRPHNGIASLPALENPHEGIFKAGNSAHLGSCVASSYHPHMFHTPRRQGDPSPAAAFLDTTRRLKIIHTLLKSSANQANSPATTGITPNRMRAGLTARGGAKGVSNFRPLTAAVIYRRFLSLGMISDDVSSPDKKHHHQQQEGGAVVWDMSAGWGGRLLGAALCSDIFPMTSSASRCSFSSDSKDVSFATSCRTQKNKNARRISETDGRNEESGNSLRRRTSLPLISHYVGTEPSIRTFQGLCEIRDELLNGSFSSSPGVQCSSPAGGGGGVTESAMKISLFRLGSEDFGRKYLPVASLDLCFTSPPYFDTELYTMPSSHIDSLLVRPDTSLSSPSKPRLLLPPPSHPSLQLSRGTNPKRECEQEEGTQQKKQTSAAAGNSIKQNGLSVVVSGMRKNKLFGGSGGEGRGNTSGGGVPKGAEPTQSYIKYPTLEAWRDGFLRQTLRNCARGLKKGRYLVLNVPVSTRTWPNAMEDVIAEAEKIVGAEVDMCDTPRTTGTPGTHRLMKTTDGKKASGTKNCQSSSSRSRGQRDQGTGKADSKMKNSKSGSQIDPVFSLVDIWWYAMDVQSNAAGGGGKDVAAVPSQSPSYHVDDQCLYYTTSSCSTSKEKQQSTEELVQTAAGRRLLLTRRSAGGGSGEPILIFRRL